MFYHYNKTKIALENGYRVINVWDWDNVNIILNFIKNDKIRIFARKCILKEVSLKDANIFLNENHLQGTCKNQSIRIGLYYNNELVSIMTFGKLRYNKNYKYELLRYCTKLGYIVNGKTKQHFTDNLLRQLGADKLIDTNYGKGTNNEDILRNNGFVEIFDCGQSIYTCKGDF